MVEEEERGVIMLPIEAMALNKQMAMLNKEVARIATKQKMAKYLENFLGKIFCRLIILCGLPCCLFCPLP